MPGLPPSRPLLRSSSPIVVVVIVGGASSSCGTTTRASARRPRRLRVPRPPRPPYPSPLPMPSALVGGWLAPVRDVLHRSGPDLGPPVRRARWRSERAGLRHRPGPRRADVREVSPGVIELDLAPGARRLPAPATSATTAGRSPTDGVWLTLEPIDDPCAIRAAVVAGNVDPVRAPRQSRRAARRRPTSSPIFSFTLPSGEWLAGGGTGVITADQSDATFKVWQDPDGFNDYCNDAMGTKVLERGIDPFLRVPPRGLRSERLERARDDDRRPPGRHRRHRRKARHPAAVLDESRQRRDEHDPPVDAARRRRAGTGRPIIGGTPWPIVITEVGRAYARVRGHQGRRTRSTSRSSTASGSSTRCRRLPRPSTRP